MGKIFSQCISNHHNVHFKYFTILYVNYRAEENFKMVQNSKLKHGIEII